MDLGLSFVEARGVAPRGMIKALERKNVVEYRMDQRFGELIALTYNVNRGKNQRAITSEDVFGPNPASEKVAREANYTPKQAAVAKLEEMKGYWKRVAKANPKMIKSEKQKATYA